MTPIKPGTASRLGLRKPTGRYVFRDGMIRDEAVFRGYGITVDAAATEKAIRQFAEAIGYTFEDWQKYVWGKR